MPEPSTLTMPTRAGIRRTRALHEAAAFDDGGVWEECNSWITRVSHVIECDNTVLGERRFEQLLGERARGARAMDVGCGTGTVTYQLHTLGASSIYSFDVSQGQVERAHAEYQDLQGVTFSVHGAEVPISGQFDLIVGRSILHHLDFKSILPRLFEQNLTPGGRMVFMEPMSHPLTLAFHRFVRKAHTADEWPLTPDDVAWLRQHFAARVVPINLTSFPVGAFSSFVLSSPDNTLMRLADGVDRWLERRERFLARGRQGIIVADRPSIKP
jgi:SAM-dependent methyltransferase